MPNLHLTDIAVRALKPTDRYLSYWDDTTPAFGIRVGKRTKTWTVMRGKCRERVTIGRYPDLSLAEARAEAKRVLAAESTLFDACETLKRHLDTAATFDGREVLIDFDGAAPQVVAQAVAPDLKLIAPSPPMLAEPARIASSNTDGLPPPPEEAPLASFVSAIAGREPKGFLDSLSPNQQISLVFAVSVILLFLAIWAL